MKTNFYILLVLFFSFTFGNAQNTSETVKEEISNTVSVSNDDVKINTLTTEVESNVKENDSILIDAKSLKESIARGASDIRIYLIRKRNEGNISLVFPQINKAVKA